MTWRTSFISWLSLGGKVIGIVVIDVYRLCLRGLIGGGTCRFQPSCSVYAREAILHYGLLKGGWKTIRRLLKCRPGGGFGWDPVLPEEY
jgi:putative membrane protein insertion efficiency factor